ncbi:MAG: hypothetical protein RR914_02385, partial [Oscillospiraceae bacterium]
YASSGGSCRPQSTEGGSKIDISKNKATIKNSPPSGICECLAFSPKTGTLLSLRDISPNRGCSRGSVKSQEGVESCPNTMFKS